MTDEAHDFVSRGGLKLAAVLDAFELDVQGMTCVDLGCNVGGFTDCLLQRGAAHVFAVDTGYGALAWKLRQDERVTVMERTNALHVDVPTDRVDLAVIDLGWTKQKHAIPAALRWQPRYIATLIKPHYEAEPAEPATPADLATPSDKPRGRKRKPPRKPPPRGVLSDEQAEAVAHRVVEEIAQLDHVKVIGLIRSPIRGGKGKGKPGNTEYLTLLRVDEIST